jgi:hypothetical protein
MWSGPKSAWKALYSRFLSIEKYTGGETFGPVVVGPCCARDDLLLGDRLCLGYGNGVLASGVWVYEAKYSRSRKSQG